MVITCLLSCIVIAAMLYGQLPTMAVVAVCAVVASVFISTRGHSHGRGGFINIDTLAISSRLSRWNAGYKVLVCTGLLVFCVASRNFIVPVAVGVAMSAASIYSCKMHLRGYLSLMLVPVSFLMLSGLAIIIEISPAPLGLLDIPLFGSYLSITKAGQDSAAMLMSHAFGGLCCLYALSLSTPMFEITSFLRRIHVPAIMVELMVLIYRYIFVLLAALNSMTTAAHARMGYSTYRNSWRSFTGIGSNLLSRSFRKAGASFDAMESRCYAGELRFLEHSKPVYRRQLVAAIVIAVVCLSELAVERGLL